MKNRVNRTVTPAMRTEFRERVGLPIGRVPSTRIFKQLLDLGQREGIKVIRDNSGFPGMIMKDRESGKVGIFVRKDMPMAFQVFVLAHELGHWRLGNPQQITYQEEGFCHSGMVLAGIQPREKTGFRLEDCRNDGGCF